MPTAYYFARRRNAQRFKALGREVTVFSSAFRQKSVACVGPVTARAAAMKKAALLESEPQPQDQPSELKTVSHGDSAVAMRTANKASGAERSLAPVHSSPRAKRAASTKGRRGSKAIASTNKRARSQARTQIGTLAIGAGIGAAVTLSVVVLRSKSAKTSALSVALIKTALYAVGRASAYGSITNVLARAVSSALD
jgi:hypothetical protein